MYTHILSLPCALRTSPGIAFVQLPHFLGAVSTLPLMLSLLSVLVPARACATLVHIRRRHDGDGNATVLPVALSTPSSPAIAVVRHRQRRSFPAWGGWLGTMLGGSNPLAYNGGGYGPGWDALFGQALLQIAGYGHETHAQPGYAEYGHDPYQQHHHSHHTHDEHLLGTHTVVTKKVAYPVPQPYPVQVEKHVPYPVSALDSHI